MNRTLASLAFAVAAVAAASASPAFADEYTPDPIFVSTRDRADVKAELMQAQRDGVNPWADHYDQLQAFESTKTRDQVTAEFLGARDEVAAMSGEDSGSTRLAQGMELPAPVMAGDLDNLQ